MHPPSPPRPHLLSCLVGHHFLMHLTDLAQLVSLVGGGEGSGNSSAGDGSSNTSGDGQW